MARWKLCASTTFESLPLSTCTLCQQESYISKGIQPIFEIFASARRCSGWAFGWKVSGAQVVYFCNGKVKTLRMKNIWHFSTVNMYTARAKILYLQVYSTDFRNLGLSSKMLRVEILGGKFHVRRYFTFVMARWKVFAPITFEILSLSTCTLCQQKLYISKCIQPIFEILAPARRCWGWAFGWKVLGAQVFYFCNGKVKTSCIDNIWKFATLNLYTVPAKILYLQRYSTDIRNLCLSSKMFRLGICGESLRSAGSLLLQWQGENFAHEEHLKFCNFQPVHCACKNPLSQKVFNRLSKSLPQLEDVEGGHLSGKFNVRRYFTFVMARWKVFATITFESLPLSTCRLCQQKSHISKGIQPIFEIFASARRFWGWAFGWKISGARIFYFSMARWKVFAPITFEILSHSSCTLCQQKSYNSKGIQPMFEIFASARRCSGWAFGWRVSCAQVFYFYNGKVKTFRIDNIWNFVTFELYTAPAKILYLQRYSTDFRNLRLNSKMFRAGIWVESFSCAEILLLQWQGENFAHRQHFQPVHCASKNPISPKVFTDFQNLWFSSKMLRVSTSVGNFCCAAILLLHWQGENFAHRQYLKFFATFNVYSVRAKILYPQRYSTEFRNLCLSSKMFRLGIWVESFRCAGSLLLLWQGEKFAHGQHLEFLPLSTCCLCQQKILYLQTHSTDFRNLCLSSKMFSVRIWVGSFQVAQVFLLFAMARKKLCASTTFESLPISTCTLCQQKSCISKGIQPIFEIFASARRCWGWKFGWKVLGAQVFYFCNGKVKTLRIDNIWKFATFNLYTVQARILYLQRYSTDFRNLCLSSKMFRLGIWVESFKCAGSVLLQWQGENFAHETPFDIFGNCQTCTLCLEKSCISKGIPKISKIDRIPFEI